jgi:hypothetical protein
VRVRIRDVEVLEMFVKKFVLLFLSLSLFGLQAHAQLAIESHTENGVTFVSGGVGGEGVQAIRAIEQDYNLRLLFAMQGSGDYLSSVDVKILDQTGRTLVDAISNGPYFLARLGPGRYRIVAESGGKSIEKRVDISSGQVVSQSLYWPAT